jgi:tetratricopeptide (TPR) repeat protein
MNFQDAINAQTSGDLKLADKIYRKLLDRDSNNFEILFNYAVLNFNLKNYVKSEDLYKKAILLNNNHPQFFNGYGVLLKELDRDEEAVEKFYKSIEMKDDYLNAHLNLFQIYKKYNNQQEMLKLIDKIILIKPNFPIMYHEKSIILQDLGKFDESLNAIKAVFKYEKHSIENYLRLHKVYKKKQKTKECLKIEKIIINLLRKEIKKKYNNEDLYNSLGTILVEFNKFKEAIIYLEKAIKINPGKALFFFNLAVANYKINKFIEAKKNYETAITLEPNNVIYNIAYAEFIKDEFQEKAKAKQIILKFDKLFPKNKIILGTKSWILINEGNYKEGWMAYNDYIFDYKNHMKLPKNILWEGEPLSGNLLVWSGQGIGDFIFFSKIVKLLSPYAEKILFICDSRLVALYKRYFNNINSNKFIVEKSYHKEKFKKHIPVEMLGHFFANNKTDIEKFSKEKLIPSKEWDTEIDNFLNSLPKKKLNIGLSWKTANTEENFRDTKLETFINIFKNQNVNLINIQFGDVKDEVSLFKEKNKINFYQLKDLNITNDIDKLASLINKLDLVITIQNSTAHISLSLGKKTFVLLSYKPPRFYWYGPDLEKSYWYPEASLYRQKNANDNWSNILNKISKDLDLIKK